MNPEIIDSSTVVVECRPNVPVYLEIPDTSTVVVECKNNLPATTSDVPSNVVEHKSTKFGTVTSNEEALSTVTSASTFPEDISSVSSLSNKQVYMYMI